MARPDRHTHTHTRVAVHRRAGFFTFFLKLYCSAGIITDYYYALLKASLFTGGSGLLTHSLTHRSLTAHSLTHSLTRHIYAHRFSGPAAGVFLFVAAFSFLHGSRFWAGPSWSHRSVTSRPAVGPPPTPPTQCFVEDNKNTSMMCGVVCRMRG